MVLEELVVEVVVLDFQATGSGAGTVNTGGGGGGAFLDGSGTGGAGGKGVVILSMPLANFQEHNRFSNRINIWK
jgi:hypothetical protein